MICIPTVVSCMARLVQFRNNGGLTKNGVNGAREAVFPLKPDQMLIVKQPLSKV